MTYLIVLALLIFSGLYAKNYLKMGTKTEEQPYKVVLKKDKFKKLGGFDEDPIFPFPQDVSFKRKAENDNWKFGISNHSYAYHLQRARENLGKPDRI